MSAENAEAALRRVAAAARHLNADLTPDGVAQWLEGEADRAREAQADQHADTKARWVPHPIRSELERRLIEQAQEGWAPRHEDEDLLVALTALETVLEGGPADADDPARRDGVAEGWRQAREAILDALGAREVRVTGS